MEAFTIKDLENLSGIKAHTIRIWEQRYSLLKPSRTDTNIRYYSNDELKKVLNISILNRYGYKISEINRMSLDEMNEKIRALADTEARLELTLNKLVAAMIDMDMELFETLIDQYTAQQGIAGAIQMLVFPFLEKIGILWQTNHITPAQEHMVSNIIRQKLIAGIDRSPKPQTKHKTIILFLPPDQYHELGLLFMQFLLKQEGHEVLYLGCDTPVKELEYVARLKKPDFIYCHLTSVAQNFQLGKWLTQLGQQLANFPVVFSGPALNAWRNKLPAQMQLKSSFQEVIEAFK
ncbi:MerR family transcriptional regulator [Sediminibacterium ginsengisoli]|uniref:DNA-binding transcriptional regulator, MerR family n=1 Tax=Sediminibacterium ginsengisoli TaxID=413434 RepID=A0A1T4JUJ3_9BACT|nr:MerR family transcriptional regulator [Sediminibacterium ginsengisoli]SJZ33880.1 DNA-binding transcriptional regulator, MerR family [Sediminibacterium ginsengisoli]